MDKKLFKIIKRKEDCVLLKKDMPPESPHLVKYFVRDIENDIIYSGYDFHNAETVFDEYDIEEVRKERKKGLEDWLLEFAEA